jgi:malate dehydrogenase (oxaloacetate-decarboxylating)(NADP+)
MSTSPPTCLLSSQVNEEERGRGMLFPSQAHILEVEITTAIRVAEFMFDNGPAGVARPADVRAWIEKQVYKPRY